MPEIAEIATLWGEVEEPPKLIAERENRVYYCRIAGQRMALRVHRPGYQSRRAIESELRWMARLAGVGFSCPMPVVSQDGSYLCSLRGGICASAVSWIDGRAIGAAHAPLAGTETALSALFHQLGGLIAKLHEATDAVETSDLERPAWNADALLGNDPLWGRFWENTTLTQQETGLLLRVRDAAQDRLAKTAGLDTGLIHADCLQENVLSTSDGLALIDFDDAGFGYRIYDLGTAMVQHVGHPHRVVMEESLIAGYGAVRAAPSQEDLRFFTMLRALASCGWVMSRGAKDGALQRRSAQRAVSLARAWLERES